MKKFKNLLYILVYLIVSLVVSIPYQDSLKFLNIASWGDYVYILDINKTFFRNLYVYQPNIVNNAAAIDLAFYAPYYLILLIFNFFHLTPLISGILNISLIIFVGCISMYIYLMSIFKNIDQKKLDQLSYIAFFGGLIYGFFPYFTQLILPGHFLTWYSVAIFPLVIKQLNITLGSKKISIDNFIPFPILFIVQSMSFGNLGILFVYFLLLFIYVLIYSIIGRKSIFYSLTCLFVVGLIFLLVNMWWLLPAVLTMGDSFQALDTQSKQTIGSSLAVSTRNSDVFSIITAQGSGPFQMLNDSISLFFNTFISFILIICNIFIFYQLILKKNRSPLIILFMSLLVITVYFIKGPNPPFSNIFLYLYENIFGFQVFRRPVSKLYWFYWFCYVNIFSVFLFQYFKESIRSKKFDRYIIVFLIVVGSCFVATFPLSKRLNPFNIPREYYSASSYFKNDNASKIILLPDLGGQSAIYDNSLSQLSGFDFISQIWDYKLLTPNNTSWLLDSLEKLNVNNFSSLVNSGIDFCSLSKKMNISHIVLRKDLLINSNNQYNLVKLTALLNKSSNVKEIKSYGNSFTVYSIKSKCRGELIYINTTSSYKKINPTKFEITVKNLKSPQKIVYSDLYDKNWNLFPKLVQSPNSEKKQRDTKTDTGSYSLFEGEEIKYLFSNSHFEKYHVIENNYSNSWLISPEIIKANYSNKYYSLNPDGSINIKLIIYFKPQSYFYLGLIICSITLISSTLYFIITFLFSIFKFKIND